MKKLLIGLILLASMSSFAKTYDVDSSEGVRIIVSEVIANSKQEAKSIAIDKLKDECHKGNLSGPQKIFYNEYNNGHEWISVQVCASSDFPAKFDVEKERIVLMTTKLGSRERESVKNLTERCEELDGQLFGQKELIRTNIYNGSVYLSAQICKY